MDQNAGRWLTGRTAAAAVVGAFVGGMAVFLAMGLLERPERTSRDARRTAIPASRLEPAPAAASPREGPASPGGTSPEALLLRDDPTPSPPSLGRNPSRSRPPSGPSGPSGPSASRAAPGARYAEAADEPGLSADTRAAIYIAGAWRSYRGGDMVSAERLLESAYALRGEFRLEPDQYDAGFRRLAENVRRRGRRSF